jgi:hypothetical protein
VGKPAMLFAGRLRVLREGAVSGGSLLSCFHVGCNLEGSDIRYTCF